MGVSIDSSDLRALIADLGKAEAEVLPEVRKVVQRGALNIKRDWQSRWSGLAHAPALPRAVSYDTRMGAAAVGAEIGPDKSRRQGALGNLIEYGSVKNAPIPGGVPALAAEQPRFERALEDLARKTLPS